jgi:hypothetical protein
VLNQLPKPVFAMVRFLAKDDNEEKKTDRRLEAIVAGLPRCAPQAALKSSYLDFPPTMHMGELISIPKSLFYCT